MTQITDHLADIRRRIDLALKRSRREGEDVTIVAVSKRQSAAAVLAAADAGLTHFGENYPQEGLAKIAAADRPGLQWHFVGKLQSNKTRAVAEQFAWVDTLDRSRIADRLAARRPESLPPLEVLIQLNLDAEPQKSGVDANGLLPLAEHVAELSRLRLRGLMCMPPAGQTADARRASFLAVAAAADSLRARGIAIDTISMGMSDDFELAVECGANAVRIGSALFGPRPPEPD